MRCSSESTHFNHGLAFALLIAMLVPSMTLLGQAKEKTNQTDQPSPFVGYFASEKASMAIEGTADQLSGEIKIGDETYSISGKAENGTFHGSMVIGGDDVKFVAKLKPKGLRFLTGLRNYDLIRQFDSRVFIGTFKGDNLSMDVERVNASFVGQFRSGDASYRFSATVQNEKLSGFFVAKGVKRPFTATAKDRVLAIKTDTENFTLKQIGFGAPTKFPVKVSVSLKETVLAEGVDFIENRIVADPMNRRVAYVSNRDGRRNPVINGVEEEVDYHVSGMFFSPDGQRMVTLIREAKTWKVKVDGFLSRSFESIARGKQFFSENSKRWAFAGKSENKWQMVVDGVESKEAYDEVRSITFSPDAKRLAFVARRGKYWHVILDDKEGPPVVGIVFNYILFSPDSKRVAYVVVRGTKQIAVVDGEESDPFDAITQLTFSLSSDRLGFIGVSAGKFHPVIDGAKHGVFDSVSGLVFSADGKRFAYRAKSQGKSVMVIDGKEDREHGDLDKFGPPIFSSDNERIAYIAVQKNKMFVIDTGAVGPKFSRVADLSFSPNGKKLIYLVQGSTNQWRYVIDNQPTGLYDEPPSVVKFSPDGKHFAFIFKRNGEILLSIDGDRGRLIPKPLGGSRLLFESAKTLSMLGQRGNKFVRLEYKILD